MNEIQITVLDLPWHIDRDLESLAEALDISWCAETAFGMWTSVCPELNQCAVTAMIVQDFFGGDLLRCKCDNGDSHYWNRLPSGKEVDLTYSQFSYLDVVPFKDKARVRKRVYVNGHLATVARYRLLKDKVLENIVWEGKPRL